ncbi:MAG: HAD-IC family P-type ATPase, partial [Eubacteriales bacterium]
LLSIEGKYLMITKGALQNILAVCTSVETSDGTVVDIGSKRETLQQRFQELSKQGFRTLGIAYRVYDAGMKLSKLNDAAIFAEIEPNQKERIIIALRKSGNVTGYIGDGINDASALHAADVGISVESAVDVAKDAADIVLLEKDLNVLIKGVQEGRVTFANTLKYVFMASLPSKYLGMATLAVVVVTFLLPFSPISHILGFGRLPITVLLFVVFIVTIYIIAAESVKKVFYKMTHG